MPRTTSQGGPLPGGARIQRAQRGARGMHPDGGGSTTGPDRAVAVGVTGRCLRLTEAFGAPVADAGPGRPGTGARP